MPGREQRRDPAVERKHFETVVATRGRLYWADQTAAGARRRQIRAARLVAASGATASDTILEIGCGTGGYSREFAPLVPGRLVSIDVSPTLASHARAATNGRSSVVAADVERLPFSDGRFAAVIGNAVLHHLRLRRAMAELRRVLRPGGLFCFAEPNYLNPHVMVEKTVPFLRRWLDDSPGETAFFRWQVGRKVAAAGFVDVRVVPFDFLYPAVPAGLVPAVERIAAVLERVPAVRELAGSLLITARRPAAR